MGWSLDEIYDRFPRLAERRKQEGVTLSGGEQQMLAVARALARDLKLLLLDEPYEGLAPVIVDEIERIVSQIKELGITTIMVEQNAVAALELANRALILDMGRIVFDGPAQAVLDERRVAQRVPGALSPSRAISPAPTARAESWHRRPPRRHGYGFRLKTSASKVYGRSLDAHFMHKACTTHMPRKE